MAWPDEVVEEEKSRVIGPQALRAKKKKKKKGQHALKKFEGEF